jgi:pyruvate,orthophosphate dikinase
MTKFVYAFEEGNKDLKNLLGGKGANLAEMTHIGLPVPEGFTITAEACIQYYEDSQEMSQEMLDQIDAKLIELEAKTNKHFGSVENPLLISVRSGAAISMPGMMDTILNLGLNDESVEGMKALTGNGRFAYDSYRRFIQMFSDVVLGIDKHNFDVIFDHQKTFKNIVNDYDLSEQDLKEIIQQYKKVVLLEAGIPFPTEPTKQLNMAIKAVFNSWNNARAKIYRKANSIPDDLGTAVSIQSMVFGNMGEDCGTGVAFTRNPATGEQGVFGEFLINAQGEDVVAGIRTPMSIHDMKDIMSELYEDFINICGVLEDHYKDMQDIEFTIENRKLYLLQTRTGKRTAQAAINIAVDMVSEGIISKEEAVMRVSPDQIEKMLHPNFDEQALSDAILIATGLPASPGAASGAIYFNPEDIVQANKRGEACILVRQETSPEDIEGMIHAEGIVTSRGGMTSHAAVVARGMGKCCVAGCSEVLVDEIKKTMKSMNKIYHEGDIISLDGNSGRIFEGNIEVSEITLTGNFNLVLEWADEIRDLGIRTNADTPKDAQNAIDFGAEGIGLCRTEHMFFDEKRIFHVREMILARDLEDRLEALEKLRPYQTVDFEEIFEVMHEKPVTIRLLDPPLHEFLPKDAEDIELLSKELKISTEEIRARIEDLSEFNPMLGHRGVRLAISYPEIYAMQARAIFDGALNVYAKSGIAPHVEIMVPLVGLIKEFTIVKELIQNIALEVLGGTELSDWPYKIGTMIEIPRAALTADQIAKEAEFFSFGTNDLTQMALGFSRDDSGKFINTYREKNIFEKDPFQTIDIEGVGKLVTMATDQGRKVRPDLKVGICGEQGGDPESIKFFHSVGLDYVSCSPFRVPIARLAAAQAKITLK